jgi:hypothetical protein
MLQGYYEKGRLLEQNLCDYWYEGELDFFVTTDIPLSQKLKDCGVFNQYCDEYLSYAKHNCKEWARNRDCSRNERISHEKRSECR